ncbi:TetR/AcrR family transcriptional regulator [Kitasatospora sp. NBC_01246]|uniref:TetR/AcrR family transcriptional regulator n=1 Tax=Kitasatospora sp. NBC_01246 TaxID=2903570 RepID=UPI002E33D544|nr:TetR/AcrR family transcriptional regulator [Kitasatospora sp. NBC_01246]
MNEDQVRRRTGGRSARVREAVLGATAELIAEHGHARISIAQIAERSGVHQTSIYRRWRSTDAIVLELAVERLSATSVIPDTGTLRGDLVAYAHGAASSIEGPDGLALLQALVALPAGSADAGLDPRTVLAPRGRDLQDMLDRAVARGEPQLHLMDVLDGIVAPLYLRVLFRIGGIDEAYLDSLVVRTLAAAATD